MKTITKYKLCRISTDDREDRRVKLVPSESKWGEYYPYGEFDTEEEALEKAGSYDIWAEWVILKVIRFDNLSS